MTLMLNSQVARLALAQALFWGCAMVGITLTALVGLQLAPRTGLATLPLALTVLGHLLSLQPLSRLMQRRGRRLGFQLGALAGVAAGLLSAWAIAEASFVLLCAAALALGAYQASSMFYRFAALETVTDAYKGRAAAYVIGGGVLAALLTPMLNEAARDALALPFAGAYLLIAAFAVLGLVIVSSLPDDDSVAPQAVAPVSIRELLKRPVIRAAMMTTAAGHGLMVLVMNATPLAMSFCGFDVSTSAMVIQWHLLGMFLPAFIAGPLVDRLGSTRVAWLGAVLLVCSAGVALSGQTLVQFLVSSCLLGMGWNLMLVAGTTLLGQGHSPAERSRAQSLMELGNGAMAAVMSFASGALIAGIGWNAVNLGVVPIVVMVVLLTLPARRLANPAGT